MQAANHQFRLEKVLENGQSVLRLIRLTTKQSGLPFMPGYQAETTETVLERHVVSFGSLVLRVEVRKQDYRFLYGKDEESLHCFETHGDGTQINPEEVGGMIGTMMGMFATTNGDCSNNQAAFDYFEVKPV